MLLPPFLFSSSTTCFISEFFLSFSSLSLPLLYLFLQFFNALDIVGTRGLCFLIRKLNFVFMESGERGGVERRKEKEARSEKREARSEKKEEKRRGEKRRGFRQTWRLEACSSLVCKSTIMAFCEASNTSFCVRSAWLSTYHCTFFCNSSSLSLC